MSRHHLRSSLWSFRRPRGPRRHRSRHQWLPLTVRLLCLYPRAWQVRYGAELAELLAEEPVSVLAILHVVVGALDAHLHPSLLPPLPRTVAERLRAVTITIFCAYVAFLVAALGFFETVMDWALAPLMRTDAALTLPWTIFAAAAILALVAVLVGGIPILVAVVKEARVVRRGDLRLFAAPPLVLLLLGGCDGVEEVLRSHRIALPAALGLTLDLAFHTLYVLAAVGCTAAVCAAVVRSAPQPQLFRFALAPGAVATLAMATTLGGAAAWLAHARADAPDRLGQSPLGLGLALLLVLMAVSAVLAAAALVRGLATRAPIAAPGTPGTPGTSIGTMEA